MIISVQQLTALYSEFASYNTTLLETKLNAIEQTVRAYTHNNFQNRSLRSVVKVLGNSLQYISGNWLWQQGDTIQISDDGLNNGLYVVSTVSTDTITINKTIYQEDKAIITKVSYPQDIVEGCIQLLRWDIFERPEHEGVASETVSRHSVSYVSYDASNTINGYPSRLFGFCNPYVKMRS